MDSRRPPVMLTLLGALSLFLCTPAVSAFVDLSEDGEALPGPDPRLLELVQTKIDDELEPALNCPDSVAVIVYLNEQPRPEISRRVRSRHERAMQDVSAQIAAAHARYRRTPASGSTEEERSLARQELAAITDADKARIRRLHLKARGIKDRMREEINRLTQAAVGRQQDALIGSVEAVGGTVLYRYTVVNALAARIPGIAIRGIAELPSVLFVIADAELEAQLDVSAPTIFAETFWNAGQSGGVWRSATLDTGVDTTHPALSGHTWTSHTFHASASGQANYDDDPNTTDDLQGHGTHVAGIQASSNSTYKGISYGSSRAMNLKAGYRKTTGGASMRVSDMMAAVDWALNYAYYPDAINLSFGSYDGTPVGYTDTAKFWDGVVDDESCPAAISAGNSGPGDETLSDPSTAYNILCVANVSDQATTSRADDVIAGNSSRGPTGDGRKKPDIAAPGTSIKSCNNSWEGTGSNFISKSGTSMAAPHITAAMTLMHDVAVYNNKAIKAVLINTAEDMGVTGWDSAFGWGYLDLNHTYFHRADYFLHSVTPRNTTTDFKLYRSTGMTAGDTATMVWHRRVIYNGAAYPTTVRNLSDLNLRLYDETNNSLISTSLTGKNNVEQVVTDRSTTHVIKAYAWSTSFDGVSSESYALATEDNTTIATGPSLSCVAGYSNYTPPEDAKFEARARVQNSGDLAAHNCYVELTIPGGMTLISGDNPQYVGKADAGGYSGYATWVLRANTAGVKTVNMSATSSSYAETWTGAGSFTVTPEAPDNVDPITVMKIGEPRYLVPGTELITNGGFESNFAGWTTSGDVSITTTGVHGGFKAAYIGMQTGNSSSIRQNISVPLARPVILSLWYKTYHGGGFFNFTSQNIQIRSQADNGILAVLVSERSTHGWRELAADLTKFRGEDVYLYCYVTSSFLGGYSDLWLDDVSITHSGKVWIRSSTDLTLLARDDRAGVDYSQYWIDSGPWTIGTVFNLVTPGEQYVYYRSVDNSGNFEAYTYLRMGLDDTAPTVTVNAPVYTTSTTELTASWTAWDPESGITGYQYAIGTSPGGADIVGWTATGSTGATKSGLSLSVGGIYYWTVKAKNGAGMWSVGASSGGTRVVLAVATIAEARSHPDGTWVALPGKIVTAVFSQRFYMQEDDRSSGIRVVWPDPPAEGAYAAVAGQVGTSYAERQLEAIAVGPGIRVMPTLPEPLGIRNNNLAGARLNGYEQQVPGAAGANNVGLLVRTWGRVTKVWADCFYIDDGSQVMDSAPTVGVLVDAASPGISPPLVNEIVEVTGISGVTTLSRIPIRILRPRRAEDVKVLAAPVVYIHKEDVGAADDFKALLDANNLPTDLISVSDAETADFLKYNLIIIGNDTGWLSTWGTPAAVANISGSRRPILGVGHGGYAFFGKLGLDIGYPHGASASGYQMYALNPGSTIYSTPNPITVPHDQILTLYTMGVSVKIIYMPSVPAGVEPIGQQVRSSEYYTLVREDTRYLLWSFAEKPAVMTTDGRALFVNAAWYVMY